MLKDLLYKVGIRSVAGDTSAEIENLQVDSRKVTAGSCFIAIKGTVADGHLHIPDAIERGATAIICEKMPGELLSGVTYVQVEDTSAAAGLISHNFYKEPSRKLKLVGVTGTNGKTTIATLLFRAFSSLGYKCGLVSTVQNQIG